MTFWTLWGVLVIAYVEVSYSQFLFNSVFVRVASNNIGFQTEVIHWLPINHDFVRKTYH